MPIRYDIVHTTGYRYRVPVSFGEHRVMFRPRDSHDLRVLATDLRCSPEAHVRMIQDPHSNSVALVTPLGEAEQLQIVCTFSIEYAPGDSAALYRVIAAALASLPALRARSEPAFARARDELTLAGMCARTEQLYGEMLHARRGAA